MRSERADSRRHGGAARALHDGRHARLRRLEVRPGSCGQPNISPGEKTPEPEQSISALFLGMLSTSNASPASAHLYCYSLAWTGSSSRCTSSTAHSQEHPQCACAVVVSASTTRSNAAFAAGFFSLGPAGRAGGAARKGHFRVRHFGGVFISIVYKIDLRAPRSVQLSDSNIGKIHIFGVKKPENFPASQGGRCARR